MPFAKKQRKTKKVLASFFVSFFFGIDEKKRSIIWPQFLSYYFLFHRIYGCSVLQPESTAKLACDLNGNFRASAAVYGAGERGPRAGTARL